MPTSIPLGPIQVNSSLFLQVFLGSQRCTCSGFYRNRDQAVVHREASTIRQVFAICKRCRAPRLFEFDVTELAKNGEGRNLFMSTVISFLDGMNALKKNDHRTAETKLLQTLNDRTGEPNFTVAHFYLGRIAMEAGRFREAIQRFNRTTLLQPMEISYHEALCEAYQANGDQDAALAELAIIEDLKLRCVKQDTRQPAFEE